MSWWLWVIVGASAIYVIVMAIAVIGVWAAFVAAARSDQIVDFDLTERFLAPGSSTKSQDRQHGSRTSRLRRLAS